MPVSWGTITDTNQHMYITEELPLLTVLAGSQKIYLKEQALDGTVSERVVSLSPAVYDGPSLATELASALTQGAATYSCTYTAGAGLGSIAISVSGITSFSLLSRAYVMNLASFAGAAVIKSQLQDASDVLGLLTTSIAGSQGTLTLGHGLGYRKIALTVGGYTFDSLATEIQTQLNAGSTMATYSVSKNTSTGRLTITNSSNPLSFYIWPAQYLEANPYAFQGYTSPFHASDDVTGFSGSAVLTGNTITAAHHVNTMAHHTLFINSTLGTHNDTLVPLSQSTIARKVVIDQPAGGFCHDFHSLPYDFLSLEPQSLSAIRFRVTDWRGNTVQMSHWSLSILFIPEELF